MLYEVITLKTHESPPDRALAEPPQKEVRVVIQERDAKRAYLDIGFHGPSIRDDDVFSWDLLSDILGSGQTSRLYREVKDARGLVDSRITSYNVCYTKLLRVPGGQGDLWPLISR